MQEASEPPPSEVEEVAHAMAAGLIYVSDASPGIRRKRCGKGFAYRADNGRQPSQIDLERIRRLVIPPAWTDVWISPVANGHIQTTGRDARGRKQYIYHPQWREFRDRHKFAHVLDFARQLPAIRARTSADMAKRGMPRDKVLATLVTLLDKTLIRVGNIEYAKQNGSYGLTTLRARHVAIEGSELRFEFTGKSGRTWRLPVRDRRIARLMRSLQELPGQHLFKYLDDQGNVATVDSSDVNGYLRAIAGDDVSAKDFRTWAGTVLAAATLAGIGPSESATAGKANLKRAIEAVASRLGNTVTISRKCYVHPDVIDGYLEGTFHVTFELPGTSPVGKGADAPSAILPEAELAVLRFLERRLKDKAAAPPPPKDLRQALKSSIACAKPPKTAQERKAQRPPSPMTEKAAQKSG